MKKIIVLIFALFIGCGYQGYYIDQDVYYKYEDKTYRVSTVVYKKGIGSIIVYSTIISEIPLDNLKNIKLLEYKKAIIAKESLEYNPGSNK